MSKKFSHRQIINHNAQPANPRIFRRPNEHNDTEYSNRRVMDKEMAGWY